MSTPRPHGPVTFDELTAGLIWPKLFRALPMSLHPSRVIIGTLLVVSAWVVLWAVSAIAIQVGLPSPLSILVQDYPAATNSLESAVLGVNPLRAASAWFAWHIGLWQNAVTTSPWASIVVLLLVAPVVGLFGGALTRSVAVDVAASLATGIRESVRFSLQRWLAYSFAILIPLILVAALSLLLVVVGAVTLWGKGFDVVGAVLFGPMLLVGLVIVVLLVGIAVGSSMLLSAVSAECTDSADAVQRVYSYLLGRPGRLMLYFSVLLVVGVVAHALITWLGRTGLEVTARLSTAALPNTRFADLYDVESNNSAATNVILGWSWLLRAVIAGWVASYFFSAGTLLYLLMRRVNDQQDIREIWFPGMIPGTQAEAQPAPAASDPEAAL